MRQDEFFEMADFRSEYRKLTGQEGTFIKPAKKPSVKERKARDAINRMSLEEASEQYWRYGELMRKELERRVGPIFRKEIAYTMTSDKMHIASIDSRTFSIPDSETIYPISERMVLWSEDIKAYGERYRQDHPSPQKKTAKSSFFADKLRKAKNG